MTILIAPDKFKGSLTGEQVCEALSEGLRQSNLVTDIVSKPMADGGDGSIKVLEHYLELSTHTTEVNDPLMRKIPASYKMKETEAFIEMSKASGLILLKEDERNCLYTTSFGTGELILDAIDHRAKEICLFIGGSATNDGGIGIAEALGFRFLDSQGKRLKPIGENLSRISEIDGQNSKLLNQEVSIKVICDVTNPFHGINGAAHVYGSQKGASKEEIEHLDKGLKEFAKTLKDHGYADMSEIPGAGAAGGVGGGIMSMLNGQLISGIHTFLDLSNMVDEVRNCDWIITGEGRIDSQTEQGKVVSGICDLAKKHDKEVIAVCGDIEDSSFHQMGISKVYSVIDRSKNLEDAMINAYSKLIDIGQEIGEYLNAQIQSNENE